MTQYVVAERFKSIQGEGLYAGTPMAFIRFVGCSVSKKICHACDTDFEKELPWRGGGVYSEMDLLLWAGVQAPRHEHVCLTGGEPLDQDLLPLFEKSEWAEKFHIETSGTKLLPVPMLRYRERLWICVSPKPGYQQAMLEAADEIKIIVPGLGSGEGWPTLDDALGWVKRFPSKPIFLQPRNGKHDVDMHNLRYVIDLIREEPRFRLSLQQHKLLRVQ